MGAYIEDGMRYQVTADLGLIRFQPYVAIAMAKLQSDRIAEKPWGTTRLGCRFLSEE